jgi:hypothetical protein
VRARRGANVAIVALARKILCILYHLLGRETLMGLSFMIRKCQELLKAPDMVN